MPVSKKSENEIKNFYRKLGRFKIIKGRISFWCLIYNVFCHIFRKKYKKSPMLGLELAAADSLDFFRIM